MTDDLEPIASTATVAPSPSDKFTAAYRARLERAGAWSERDQRDEAYRRGELAKRLRGRLPAAREQRKLDRSYREDVAIAKRSDELYRRHGQIYYGLWLAIAERVRREHRIRRPGKSHESERRYRRQMEEVIAADSEYLALDHRRDRFFTRHWAMQKRNRDERLAAGVLAVDDRETGRRKVQEWREGAAG